MRDADWLPPQPQGGQWQPATEPTAPAPYQPPRESLLKRIFGPLVVIGLVIAKWAAKLKFLLVALKGVKFLSTSASMLVSIAAYTLIWGWRFAIGFVALLFVHEMGHYIQLRREGVQPSGMLFLPFLGAVVGARSLGGNALAEARVGLAGPILGALGAAAVAIAGEALDSDLLRALAFTGFFLNLFNLAPVLPLDGGRAMAAMAPWMWFLGLGLVALTLFIWPSPILILILILGAFEVYKRWNARRQGYEGNQDYYKVSPMARLAVGAVYIGLMLALAYGMYATHLVRTFADV